MLVISFILGTILGSFYNVLIYRLPKGMSVAFPRSHCPNCNHTLGPVDLVPILSFIITKAKCRYCGMKISPRYPLIELFTGLMFALTWFLSGNLVIWGIGVTFFSILFVLSAIDLEHMILPNPLTIGGLVLGLILSLGRFTVPFTTALIGAGVGLGIITLVVILSKGGMGLGDAKLLGMVGAFLGPWGALGALFWGSVFGSVIGIALILFGRHQRKQPIPFGPFLSLGALMMWFTQDYWINLILHP